MLGNMLVQNKINEARRLTPEQRLLVALALSDAAVALHHAGFKKRQRKLSGLMILSDTCIFHSPLLSFSISLRFSF